MVLCACTVQFLSCFLSSGAFWAVLNSQHNPNPVKWSQLDRKNLTHLYSSTPVISALSVSPRKQSFPRKCLEITLWSGPVPPWQMSTLTALCGTLPTGCSGWGCVCWSGQAWKSWLPVPLLPVWDFLQVFKHTLTCHESPPEHCYLFRGKTALTNQ